VVKSHQGTVSVRIGWCDGFTFAPDDMGMGKTGREREREGEGETEREHCPQERIALDNEF